ncbi:MAG TPA: DUF2167 domain-containing protein [Burkholderiales bacterium]|jgi:uncharacterized membrane-anchored protein|nr:DUF2167 domain-containing protein [Burkholderiales bacterium]
MKTTIKACIAGLLCMLCMGAIAQEQPAQAEQTQAPSEMEIAAEAARLASQPGPADIRLRDQATLKLSQDYVFIPPKEAGALMTAMGNYVDENFLGLVVPAGDASWFVVLRYEPSGYIRDDDAKDWDAKELLDSLKAGTEEGNKERAKRGIAEMEIVGWVQQPVYEASTHRLRWSLSSRDKGAPAEEQQGINYNTYALGREGYISLNLVTDLSLVAQHKPAAEELLAALHFEPGKSYADFNAETDHVAEYGLAALVAGVAAKKLGMFAVIAAFFVKFGKVIALGALAMGGGAFKVFKRKKEQV